MRHQVNMAGHLDKAKAPAKDKAMASTSDKFKPTTEIGKLSKEVSAIRLAYQKELIPLRTRTPDICLDSLIRHYRSTLMSASVPRISRSISTTAAIVPTTLLPVRSNFLQ